MILGKYFQKNLLKIPGADWFSKRHQVFKVGFINYYQKKPGAGWFAQFEILYAQWAFRKIYLKSLVQVDFGRGTRDVVKVGDGEGAAILQSYAGKDQ